MENLNLEKESTEKESIERETIEKEKVINEKGLNEKFCQHCGNRILKESVICVHCGCQVEELKQKEQPQVIINNTNSNTNSNVNENTNINNPTPLNPRMKNKWIAFLLCLFVGYWGIHKFYEGKILLGVIYFFTGGLFLIGWLYDCIRLLFRPNPYYV